MEHIKYDDLPKFNDYLDCKNIKADDMTKDEVFRAGQMSAIASLAGLLGVSLTYNNLDWAEEIGSKLRKEKEQDNISDVCNRILFNTDISEYDGIML